MAAEDAACFQNAKPRHYPRPLGHAARVAVTDALAVAPGERVLIVTNPDAELSRVALAVHDQAAQAGGEPVLMATQPRSGAQLADPALLRALETDPEILVLLTKGRIGGDPERLARPLHGTYTHYLQYLLSETATRGFWSHGLSQTAFTKGVPVDQTSMRQEAKDAVERLQTAVELHIVTGRDDRLVVPVVGEQAQSETGDYRTAGATGELPSGEVYLPVGPGAAGTLQVTGTIGLPEGSLSAREGVEVTIDEGRVEKIDGGQSARQVEAAIAAGQNLADHAVGEGWLTRSEADQVAENVRVVKEVAFGLNPALKPRGEPFAHAKARGALRVVIGAGRREFPPGAPVSLEFVVPGAKVVVVSEDGTEAPFLPGGGLPTRQAVRG